MIKPDKTYILFHYTFSNLAGTERVLSNLVEMICARGGRVILLLASGAEKMAIDLSAFPLEIHYLDCGNVPSGSSLRLMYAHYRLYRKTAAYLRQVDLGEHMVILSTNVLLSAIAYLACRRLGKRNVAFISCEHFSLHVAGSFSRLVRKKFYRHMTVVTLTERDRNEVLQEYRPAACRCIPNASPFGIQENHYNPDNKNILAIGRLSHQKGFDLLVTAFAAIASRYPDWTLSIVGDDFGSGAQIKQMIGQYKITNIELRPATKDVEALYRNAAFFVLSSRFEGLPMVLIEAISFGLPVVAFDCPTGPSEIIDNDSGFLVANGDVAQFAGCMEQLMNSRELMLEKSRKAAERAKAFTKQEISRLWEDVL